MIKKMTLERANEMLEEQGFHCSQCVFSHAAEIFGLDPAMALKMSSGLGGGCFCGGTCGTVTAAALAISMAYGYDQPNSDEQNDILVEKLQEFKQKFTDKNGSLYCKDLLGGYCFSIPEDEEIISEQDLTKNCPQFCVDACDILDEILADYTK